MTNQTTPKFVWKKWIGRACIAWGIFAFTYLFSGYRTVDVDPLLLKSNSEVAVKKNTGTIHLIPKNYTSGLIFFCGSGVSATAYVPLLKPLVKEDLAVFIVKLPFRFAFLESHRLDALQRAKNILEDHSNIKKWIVSGHSLGGALASRMAFKDREKISGLVLIGTTHPKKIDLSSIAFPVTKIYGSEDGIATAAKVNSNSHLLPVKTKFVLIKGGNHIQFANYSHQFLDGSASISREQQQQITRNAIQAMLSSLYNA